MKRLDAWKILIIHFLPKLPRPHGNLKLEGFYNYARKLSDPNKTMLRRMLACLDMHNIVEQDNKLTYALWTTHDRKANRIRSKNRRTFEKLGIVKKGDGKHIHHVNGNVFDNRRRNLRVVDGKKHKRAHANANVVANLTCKAFLKQFKVHANQKNRASSSRGTKKS